MKNELVLPGIRRIRVFMSLGFVSVYLVDAGDGPTLVDAGSRSAAPTILGAIAGSGRALRDIRHLALSHAHFDHVGGVRRVAIETGARTWIHTADAAPLQTGQPGPLPTLEPRLLAAIMRRLRQPAFDAWPELTEFEDGELVAGDLRAVHTPGHSPGHTIFLWPRHGGVLFAGDSLTNLGRLRLGLVNERWPEAKRSIRRIAELEFETIVFGHGPPIRGRAVTQVRRLADALAV